MPAPTAAARLVATPPARPARAPPRRAARPARRPFPVPRALPPPSNPPSSTTPWTPAAPDPFATRETHVDGPFARFMIGYFAKRMAAQLGKSDYRRDYDGFVDLSREIVRGRSSEEQRRTVSSVLASLLPPGGPARFRALFPLSRWAAEANAAFTMAGFAWLVGPMEVRETEVTFKGNTETWKSAVHIKKCRYLETSGCVGLCVNLCKRPTEAFFGDAFGLPLTMNPNFDDLSCDMLFGVHPPPIEQDAVYNQPCFAAVCDMAAPGGVPCPKVDTVRSAATAAKGEGGGKGGG